MRACRARVVLGAKMVPELAAKLASLRGNAADQARGVSRKKIKLDPSGLSLTIGRILYVAFLILCGTHTCTRDWAGKCKKLEPVKKCTSEKRDQFLRRFVREKEPGRPTYSLNATGSELESVRHNHSCGVRPSVSTSVFRRSRCPYSTGL